MHPDREPLTTGTPCYGRIGTMVNPASGEGRETARNVTWLMNTKVGMIQKFDEWSIILLSVHNDLLIFWWLPTVLAIGDLTARHFTFKSRVSSPKIFGRGRNVRRILVRGLMPPCRLRRRKFDYEMVHSEVYLSKYVVSIAPFSTHACPDCSQNIT